MEPSKQWFPTSGARHHSSGREKHRSYNRILIYLLLSCMFCYPLQWIMHKSLGSFKPMKTSEE